MDDLVLHLHVTNHIQRSAPMPGRPARPDHDAAHATSRSMPSRGTRARDQRGEGVISAAIAVLIMAFLGVGVWLGFRATLDDTQQKVDSQVEEIGR